MSQVWLTRILLSGLIKLQDDITTNDIFKEGGCLKDILDFYEHRDSQQKMAVFLENILERGENALIEAGTGTGKTLAYLIPLAKHILDTGRKAAVSTETKALQMQLIEKDLPAVETVLKNLYGYELKSSLCLGSSNYPCYARFNQALNTGSFLYESIESVEQIRALFEAGEIFSYYDLDVSSSLWAEIGRDPDFCNMKKCPYKRSCVYVKVRKEWNSADLLIMNHYLFFSHIKTGKTYLPHFDMIVFDEAHSIHDIACSQMGFNINKKTTGKIINNFRISKSESLIDKISNKEVQKKVKNSFSSFVKDGAEFHKLIKNITPDTNAKRLRKGFPEGENYLKSAETFWKLYDKSDTFFDENEILSAQYESSKAKLFQLYNNLNMAVYGYEENWVYWLDSVYGGESLCGQPISADEIFRDEVYGYYESAVFVSATLSVNKNFFYTIKKLGLYEPETLLLESPFNYKCNCSLFLSSDNVNPSSTQFTDYVIAKCTELIEHTDGKTLILFTSYKMLNDVQEELEDNIDHEIFSQSDFAASKAVEYFKNTENAVLMGTHSMWQGVDLQGDILKNVIITKLPFQVPNRPDIESRIEKIVAAGGNSFSDFQIPEAVIRFKQGFGRLIRSGSDSGTVAVLDPRITQKGYGRFFVNSLPECRIIKSITD